MLKLPKSQLDALFEEISKKQALYLPVRRTDGEAQFMPWSEGVSFCDASNTIRSAKDFFFPQTENLADFRVQGKTVTVIDPRKESDDFVLFGVRACDARSFEILDKVFLAEPIDSYYKNRREHGTVVALACTQPEETCFCGAFGIDPANPAGDVSAWLTDDALYLSANTPKGEALLGSLNLPAESDCAAVDAQKEQISQLMKQLPLANLSFEAWKGKPLLEAFSSPKWAELSEACLGCGTCTFFCPTCQCYDIRDFDTGHGIKRFRCWDSCMYSDFTRMAHGNPRLTQLERFRQRFMHKLVYFPENNNGQFGCVGCGRCLAKCPISMNIVKVMKTLGEEK